jgi:hypothetical protein
MDLQPSHVPTGAVIHIEKNQTKGERIVPEKKRSTHPGWKTIGVA